MKVAVIHNYYQQAGGEDEVFRSECQLLESHGHTVLRYSVDNAAIEHMGRATLAAAAVWNLPIYRELRDFFRRETPAVAHFHNTFPLISPAGYYAAKAERVGVVQTLHNYRLLCPNAILFRDGRICEECVGKLAPWPGVLHACYRRSRLASGVTAAMLSLHRVARTWERMPDVYIALSDFARHKFVAGGLSADKIVVKPNALTSDPGLGKHAGRFGLFVGRLAPEKGLGVLVDAWTRVNRGFKLKVIGGPLPEPIETTEQVEWLGAQPKERVYAEMQAASFLIFPSEWYENCPMTIIEAFATGLPVLASNLGAPAEMVLDGRTGLHFRPGDAADLSTKINWAFTHPDEIMTFGQGARMEFEHRYSSDSNYGRLMEIYALALSRSQRSLSSIVSPRLPSSESH